MSDFTVCAVCASFDCDHAIEPERFDVPRWEVEVEHVHRYWFGVLADNKREAEVCALEAVDSSWEPDDQSNEVNVSRTVTRDGRVR